MAYTYTGKCKICNIIKSEIPPGGTIQFSKTYGLMEQFKLRRKTAKQIVFDRPELTLRNISIHCSKHQTVPEGKAAKVQIQESTVKEMKAELIELRTRVFGIEQTKSDINTLTDWLMKQVEEGNVKPSLGPLVNLVGKAAAIHEKEVDQGISMMGLMAKYASAEVKQLDKPDQMNDAS